MRADITIRTPEGISFCFTPATPVVRALAWFIDVMILTLLLIISSNVAMLLRFISADISQAVQMLGYFILQVSYGMVMEWFWRGQTVGKRAMRIRVIDARGARLQFSQVAVRNLMRFIDILPFMYCIGGIACLFTRHMQRLGDIAADTAVVRLEKLLPPDSTMIDAGKYNSLREFPHFQSRLRRQVSKVEAAVALKAVLRRENLEPEARTKVFAELAKQFRSAVPLPPDITDGVSDEQYIRNVVECIFRDAK